VSRQDPTNSADTAALLDELTTRMQEALGEVPVLCAFLDRGERLRFRGSPPAGKRPPSSPLSEFPAIAETLRTGFPSELSPEEAVRFGVDRGVAVSFFAAADGPGVCVLLGPGQDDRPPEALLGLSKAIGSTLGLIRERDGLRRRLGELEQTVSGFRALMESTSDAVKIVDLDGRVRAWNAGCETLYGYTAREVIGHVLPHMSPDDRSRAVADFRRIASMGIVEEDRELVAVRKDGSRVAVAVSAVPLQDTEGLPAGVLTIVRRVDADSRLDRMQGDFLSLVSQELRNPLTAVLGFAQLLARPEIAEDPTKRARTVRALESRTQEMAAVVDDLLLASRIERGELRLRRQPSDIATLVTETVTRFEQFQPRHRFLIDVDTRIPHVDVDVRRIEQALTNLLSNAVKYSPGSEDVRISALPDGDQVVLSVTDAGEGIPAEDIDRVFDRFYKSGASKDEPGAGLGLYLVRVIAEAHGGSVSVASEPKKGSTFTIKLPFAH
jgi:PAS domain S-box-containing protein